MTILHQVVLVSSWAVLGLCAGSFLNVCVHRVPRGMSVLRPRSRCPLCGSAIRARDNVPVLGWLFLRGRCRECRAAIPARYPAVELAIGALFTLPYLLMAALYAGDPWERFGTGRSLVVLLSSWAVMVFGAYAILARPAADSPFTRRRAGGGCGGPASSALPSRAGRG